MTGAAGAVDGVVLVGAVGPVAVGSSGAEGFPELVALVDGAVGGAVVGAVVGVGAAPVLQKSIV